MPTVDPLVLRLQADLAQYNRKIEASTLLVDRSLKRQEDAVARLEFQMAQSSGAIGAGFRSIATAAAGVSVIALARQFLTYADAAKQMEAQLRLATQAFGAFGIAQQDVARISEDARAGLKETTALYGSFLRSAQELGKTQGQAAQATETFTKALKIGGAAPQQVASATLQLGQALASANVQWEELGEILEASPRLAKVFTDSLGVTRGQLKKMAEDGKLSSEQLFDALNKTGITQQIDEEFKTLPVTFADAMQQVENAAITTFGAFDRGGEFSTAIATFVSDGSDGFRTLATDAERLGIDIRATMAGLSDAFDPMLEGARSVFAQIGLDGRSVLQQIQGDISNILGLYDRLQNFGVRTEAGIRRGANALVDGGVLRRDWYYTPENQMPQLSDAAGRFNRRVNGETNVRVNRAEDRRVDAMFDRLLGRVPKPNQIGDYLAGTGSFAPRTRPAATGSGSGKKKGPKGPPAETLARREDAQRQRELRRDEEFEREKSGIDQDILRARRSIATAADTVAQFELDEIEAARARAVEGYKADAAKITGSKLETEANKKLAQVRADELILRRNQLAAAEAAVVNAREAERKRADAAFVAEGDLTNSLDLLNAQGQLADTAKERREIALRILDAELAIEKARLEEVIASRQSSEAEKQRARNRLAALPGIRDAERQNVERQNEGSLARFRRRLNDPASDVEDAVAQKLQEVDDAIADAAAKTLGIKDPFLKRLLQIFLEQNVLKPLYDAAQNGGSTGGFLGSIIKAVPAIFGRASGGYVGPGQMVRVNEQRGAGVELLRMGSQGGTVIPLGQANASARQAPTAVYQTFVLDNRGGITTPELIEQMNGLARQAAIEGAAGGRALAAQDMRNANRPRI